MNDEVIEHTDQSVSFRQAGPERVSSQSHPETPAERRLRDAAARGDWCRCDDAVPATGTENNRIRAAYLRFLLLGGDEDTPVHEKGIRLHGAYVDGVLDLEGCEGVRAFFFHSCRLSKNLELQHARLRTVDLSGSRILGIQGDGSEIDGFVLLRGGFAAEGAVRFVGAQISKDLDCSGGSFTALRADRGTIDGNVWMGRNESPLRFAATGSVTFYGATIGGSLLCHGGTFAGGLLARGAKVSRDVDMSCSLFESSVARFEAKGAVDLTGSEIGGSLLCSGGIFDNPGAAALHCSSAKIDGHVQLSLFTIRSDKVHTNEGRNARFEARGEVNLLSATIGGHLECDGARLQGGQGTALQCASAKIGGSVFLRGYGDGSQYLPFEAGGQVCLLAAHVNGDLDCTGGMFNNPKGLAINANLAKFGTNVRMSCQNLEKWPQARFQANGGVSLWSAELGGSLLCGGASFENSDAVALECSTVKIKGHVVLGLVTSESGNHQRFEARGQVSFQSATIDGTIECSGASFTNKDRIALQCGGVRVGGAVCLRSTDGSVAPFAHPPFEADGEVSLVSAQIRGDLDCSGGTFNNPPGPGNSQGVAINASRAKVAGDVFMTCLNPPWPQKRLEAKGGVLLGGAEIGGALRCDGASLVNPSGIALDGSSTKVEGGVSLSCIGHHDEAPAVQFQADGEVNFVSAQISRYLDCSGGRFRAPAANVDRCALICDGAQIGGTVFLRAYDPVDPHHSPAGKPPFQALGEVRFVNASIEGQFTCLGGRFRNHNAHIGYEGTAAAALSLANSRIKGSLFLGVEGEPGASGWQLSRDFQKQKHREEPPKIEGTLDLEGTSTDELVDHLFVERLDERLPKKVTDESGVKRNCHVILDGFTYSRIGGRSSCNAKHRKAWLKRQIPEHLGNNYRPQPFEQLVKVLRLMGHDRDAKAIAIAKRRYQSRQNWWPRWVLEKLFLDILFGYGYRFLWANTVMLGMWVAFALSAETAYMQGAIVPRLDVARLDDDRVKQFEDCRPPKKGDWKDCKMPQLQYQTAFQSWVFALDSILPIPALGARAEWRILSDRPIRIAHTELPGGTVQYVQWVVVGAGWIYGFFFAAFLSGFIKKD